MEQTTGETTETVKTEEPKPEEKKRRKYSPRQGVSCPTCGENIRSCFATLNEGGLRVIPYYGACHACKKIYRLALLEPETIKKEGN